MIYNSARNWIWYPTGLSVFSILGPWEKKQCWLWWKPSIFIHSWEILIQLDLDRRCSMLLEDLPTKFNRTVGVNIPYMVVSWNRGTPKSSIYRWIFHYKPTILDTPMTMETPHMEHMEVIWCRCDATRHSLVMLGIMGCRPTSSESVFRLGKFPKHQLIY